MSPSIAELFGDVDGETDGVDLNIDRLTAEFETAMGRTDSGVAGSPAGDPAASGPGSPSPDSGELEGGEPPVAGSPPVAPPSPSAAPPAADDPQVSPFESLSPVERESLLSLHQVMSSDPAKRDAILRAVVGGSDPNVLPAAVPVTSPAPPAPVPPPAPPELPSDIEEGTPEARLWHQQQQLQSTLDQMQEATRAERTQRVQSIAADAANRAANAFAARYNGTLTNEDMMVVARQAAARGLPGALAKAAAPAGAEPTPAQLEAAYYTAMDMTMRSNDTYLTKVLGGAPPAAPAAPSASTSRKRKLTAISGAAAPAGGGNTRPPLTTRSDGRLDEKSRMSVVTQAANALKGIRSEL